MVNDPEMNSETLAILISLLSCLVAFISAIYARKSRDIAQKANEIALHTDLKPARLATYNILRDFADYCCGYYTLQCAKAVKGTRDISNRIGAVKWELDSYGPLGMADVEEKANNSIIKLGNFNEYLIVSLVTI